MNDYPQWVFELERQDAGRQSRGEYEYQWTISGGGRQYRPCKKEDAELLDKVCNDLSGQGLFWIEKIAMGGYCVFLLLNNGEWN